MQERRRTFSAGHPQQSKARPGQKSWQPQLVPHVHNKWHTDAIYEIDLGSSCFLASVEMEARVALVSRAAWRPAADCRAVVEVPKISCQEKIEPLKGLPRSGFLRKSSRRRKFSGTDSGEGLGTD